MSLQIPDRRTDSDVDLQHSKIQPKDRNLTRKHHDSAQQKFRIFIKAALAMLVVCLFFMWLHQVINIVQRQSTSFFELNQAQNSKSRLKGKNPSLQAAQSERSEYLSQSNGNSQQQDYRSDDQGVQNYQQMMSSRIDTANKQISSPAQRKKYKANLTAQCQHYIERNAKQRGYLYELKLPYEELQKQSAETEPFFDQQDTNISFKQRSRAIKLLGAIHHLDDDGNIVAEDTPCEQKQKLVQRLQSALLQQSQELQRKYQISRYKKRPLRFCLVVNSYKNALKGLIYRNIDSILQQDYDNFHVVYTDDHSSDDTATKVKAYLQKRQNSRHASKFKVIINPQNTGMMANIYKALHDHCNQGEVAAMLDGDDSLIGRQVFSLFNAVYQKQKQAVIWSQFLITQKNQQLNVGFCQPYAPNIFRLKAFRRSKKWVSTHLKTFWVDLFRKIDIRDFQQTDGKFYGGASDTALMMPLLQLGYPRLRYLPQIVYEYRYDTGYTGNMRNKPFQKSALSKIFASKPYQPINDFSFIDHAVQKIQIQENYQNQQEKDQNQKKNQENVALLEPGDGKQTQDTIEIDAIDNSRVN